MQVNLLFVLMLLVTLVVLPISLGLAQNDTATQDAQQQERRRRRVVFKDHAHDPALVKEGDWYYVYVTGRGIIARRSKDLVHWEDIGQVFDELPVWTREVVPDARGFWAPDLAYFNDRWHLYYSVSSFGRNRSAIGLVTTPTLDPDSPDYTWTDQGKVVESFERESNFNAIDGAPVVDENGTPWLAFGSYWGGLRLFELDPATGKAAHDPPDLITIATRNERPYAVEAPFILRHGEFYYLFMSYDRCCNGVDSTYRIMVGRAKDVRGPYLDREGKSLAESGATELLAGHDYIRGPGHNSVLVDGDTYYLAHHYYDARHNGAPRLHVRPMTFEEDGWPVLGEPVGEDDAIQGED